MALLKNQIKPPVLPAEAVDVPELGGEVIVRGLLLRQRLDLAVLGEEGGFHRIALMLASCVVDASISRSTPPRSGRSSAASTTSARSSFGR